MTANAEHAAHLVGQADEAMHRRRVLLVAATALGTTNSIAAAIRSLAEWKTGPVPVITEAIAVLDALRTETTGTAATEAAAGAT